MPATNPVVAPKATFLFQQMDILAHLFFAAGTCDRVDVSWAEGRLEGTFEYPDGSRVVIVHTLEQPAPRLGAVVFVEYSGPSDHYRFFTTVVDHFRGRLVVAFPNSIECSDRRLSLRLHLPTDSPVRVFARVADGYVETRPVDISDGGMALAVQEGWPYLSGQVFEAYLDLGEETMLAMSLESRHFTPGRDGAAVGCRLQAMSLSDRARLAQFLVSSRGVEASYVA